jgi:hypothetical protein
MLGGGVELSWAARGVGMGDEEGQAISEVSLGETAIREDARAGHAGRHGVPLG